MPERSQNVIASHKMKGDKNVVSEEYNRLALKQKQSLPLDGKVILAQRRIREWYEHWDGQVYVSFSGGKDSTALLHLVRDMYPDVPAVFIDTGLEFPEIRKFAMSQPNVTVLRPEMRFDDVIKAYGYPVIGKEVANCIYYARNGSSWALNYLHGLDHRGQPDEWKQRYKRYGRLMDAPFPISSKCCSVMKKKPISKYERLTAGCNGKGWRENESYTLNTIDRPAVVFQTAPSMAAYAQYIVRRLTPLECCRLQGFPDYWMDGVDGSDSAKYKMWGNGMALPCMLYVMDGIARAMTEQWAGVAE